jgi:hypothetical protein
MSGLTEPRKSASLSRIIERERPSGQTVLVNAHSARPANIDPNYRR